MTTAWRDIKDAPRDGTPVLLCFADPIGRNRKWGRIRLGSWRGEWWQFESPGFYRPDKEFCGWMFPPPPPEDTPHE